MIRLETNVEKRLSKHPEMLQMTLKLYCIVIIKITEVN